MEGWIRLHRQLKEHWIWKSDNRLKWWIDMLLTVNYIDNKVLIKGNLVDCKRGQCVRSLETWAKGWNVSKGAVRDFFNLLSKDQMIRTESLHFTTRITILNYESYQSELYNEETMRKRSGNDEETMRVHNIRKKESKEIKKVKKICEISEMEISDPYQKITFHFWSLFKTIINGRGIPATMLDKANIYSWSDQVRLMIENKECTYDQLRDIYKWLKVRDTKNSQFWADNIQSTISLRRSITKILTQLSTDNKGSEYYKNVLSW